MPPIILRVCGMTAPSYLYCIEFTDGMDAAKIGISFNPEKRLKSVAATAPHPMRFRHVLRIADRAHAAAQERRIISSATRYRERGEWVTVDETLDRLFASVPMAENVTAEFSYVVNGRYFLGPGAADNRARKATMSTKVGPLAVAFEGYQGDPKTYDRALVQARLADGYGVQDILVMDGIPEEFSRAVIFNLEKSGKLRSLVLRHSPHAAE